MAASNRAENPMHRYIILTIIGCQTALVPALAQPSQTEASPPPSMPSPEAPASPPLTMEQPSPGDHWTYELHDEILGTVKSTRTVVVTEVSPTEISTRYTLLGNPNSGSAVFDRSWNVISSGEWRYGPNDGTGVRLPLAVGKTWTFKSNSVNSNNGASWSRSGTSKVVGQESVTTKAGTFDTFKIETSISNRNVSNPSRISQITLQTWYAPSIDHWVKRASSVRADGHLTENNTVVLVEYGRKP
jgi:hypothetical protein